MHWAEIESERVMGTWIEPKTSAIVWGHRRNELDEKEYEAVLVYAAKDVLTFERETFYILRDLDLRGSTLRNFKINPKKDGDGVDVDGGITKYGIILLTPDMINLDGTINTSYLAVNNIRKGFVTN